MYKTLIALLFVAFAFSACNSDPKSQVSSTKTNKLLDNEIALEIQQQKEEILRELNQIDSRVVEINLLINEVYSMDNPEMKEKYSELMAMQAEFYQAKSHYEMEKSMFIDKVMNEIVAANSKEDLRARANKLFEELKHQGDMYMNAGRNLLNTMRAAGIESPLMDEIMNANGDGSGDMPEGEPVIEGEVH